MAGDIDIGNYRSWAGFWSRPWSTAWIFQWLTLGLHFTENIGQEVTDVSDIWATSSHADFMESIWRSCNKVLQQIDQVDLSGSESQRKTQIRRHLSSLNRREPPGCGLAWPVWWVSGGHGAGSATPLIRAPWSESPQTGDWEMEEPTTSKLSSIIDHSSAWPSIRGSAVAAGKGTF